MQILFCCLSGNIQILYQECAVSSEILIKRCVLTAQINYKQNTKSGSYHSLEVQ